MAAFPALMHIEVLSRADDALIEALSGLLADNVEGGASLGFMAPFDHELGQQYWRETIAEVAAGDRTILVAFDEDEALIGAVHLAFSWKPNAIHRAEVQKLLVSSHARRRGTGTALMQALEQAALQLKKPLLMLDTETGSAACALYEGMGWQFMGTVPGHAYRPHGGLGDTNFYYKQLGESP